MISCIYKIVNKANRKIYVGQTINFYVRSKRHQANLLRNRHPNRHLQNAWNLYGPDNFSFEIIERCLPLKDVLCEREQFYMDSLMPEYNICPRAGTTLGRAMTEETKNKLRKSQLGQRTLIPITLTRIENEPADAIWASIKYLYDKKDHALLLTGSILNQVFTTKVNKVELSVRLAFELIKADPNIPIEDKLDDLKSEHTRKLIYRALAKISRNNAFVRCIRPSKKALTGIKSAPGLYEIANPHVIKHMDWLVTVDEVATG